MKYYAIKEGFDSIRNVKIENTIVNTWSECERLVKGVKGAKYKSFKLKDEAEEYLNDNNFMKNNITGELLKGITYAYVDGSYNTVTGKYGYAVVIVRDDVIIHIENGCGFDKSEKNIRQIAGELEASIKAIEYAVKNRLKQITIVHDYLGVCFHATGEWERKDMSSKIYYEKINSLIKEGEIKVDFLKVDSHTGNLFNEVVDEFAKASIDVKIKGETEKLLKNNVIKVQNDKIKNKFNEILVKLLEEKIHVVV